MDINSQPPPQLGPIYFIHLFIDTYSFMYLVIYLTISFVGGGSILESTGTILNNISGSNFLASSLKTYIGLHPPLPPPQKKRGNKTK